MWSEADYKNKIICGNCNELIKNLPDKSIDLIYTDVPYDYGSSGKSHKENESGLSKRKSNNYNDLSDMDITLGFDYSILDEFCRVEKKILIYIWCSKAQIKPLMDYYVDKKGCQYNIFCWTKTNPIPAINNSFLSDIEYLLMFFEPGACGFYSNDVHDRCKWYNSPINVKDKDKFEHPTIKPVVFVERQIRCSCPEGGIVLDPFMGSGTTGVACKNNNRNYVGFEISPKYAEIADKRLHGELANGQLSMFVM